MTAQIFYRDDRPTVKTNTVGIWNSDMSEFQVVNLCPVFYGPDFEWLISLDRFLYKQKLY